MSIEKERACGYCAREKSCSKRAKYMRGIRRTGGTKELAFNCKDFIHFKNTVK